MSGPTVQVKERATGLVMTIALHELETWQLRGWQMIDGTIQDAPAKAAAPAEDVAEKKAPKK